MIVLVVVSYIVLGILLLLFAHLLINLLSFHRLRASTKGNTPSDPFVSLLVPARNEEAHIEMCVRSLVGQHYEQLEVFVLDDRSCDATAAIVQAIIDELPPTQKGRLQLLHGDPLPVGWVGKNFACYQLSRHAQGEYLFFTDADTVHAPETVKAVIDCMHSLAVDLLTAQMEYKLKGIAARLVMPLLCFRVFTLLPLTLVSRRPEPNSGCWEWAVALLPPTGIRSGRGPPGHQRAYFRGCFSGPCRQSRRLSHCLCGRTRCDCLPYVYFFRKYMGGFLKNLLLFLQLFFDCRAFYHIS